MQLETNVRAEVSDSLGATDASDNYGGMFRVRAPFSAAVNLYDRCEGPSEHFFSQLPYVITPGERKM